MDIDLFDCAPLYIPTDLRKLILLFSSPVHAYVGCVIEDRNYMHVLGVFRTLVQAEKKCLNDKVAKIRITPARYHILKVREGENLPAKIKSRLLYPSPLPTTLYHTINTSFNKTCAFCMEKFERHTPVVRLPCNHVFHSGGIQTWLKNTLHCPLCRKIVRDGLPSPLEAGEIVYIDEIDPYVIGVGGTRRFVLSLSDVSQRNLDYYSIIESEYKIKLHPKGGGVPHPYKFYIG